MEKVNMEAAKHRLLNISMMMQVDAAKTIALLTPELTRSRLKCETHL